MNWLKRSCNLNVSVSSQQNDHYTIKPCLSSMACQISNARVNLLQGQGAQNLWLVSKLNRLSTQKMPIWMNQVLEMRLQSSSRLSRTQCVAVKKFHNSPQGTILSVSCPKLQKMQGVRTLEQLVKVVSATTEPKKSTKLNWCANSGMTPS